MSCRECEKIQEANKEGRECAYLRIGNGNVLIGACDKHFNMLRNMTGHEVDEDSPVVRTI